MPVNYINLADIDRNIQQSKIGDMQIENMQLARQDRERQLQQQARAEQQQMQLRDIYKGSGGDLNKARQELYNQGFYEQGAALDKQLGEQSKQRADIGKTELETNAKRLNIIGSGMKFILDNPSKDNAISVFNGLRTAGVLTPEQYQEYTEQLPDDPALIKRGAEVLFRGAIDAKDQLSKFSTENTGGQMITQGVDPITGKVTQTNVINRTQSPDSIANNARMAEEGAANRAVQMRGQNLTDARARESNSRVSGAGGEKITEAMRTTGQYAARMAAAEKLMENNTEQATGVGEKIAGMFGETSANLARSPERQKALQAQLDWVRAKLRKESGAAIGIDEMNNEILTYFPQIGDSPEAIEQKRLARQQAVQGMIESSGGAYNPPSQRNIPVGTPIMPRNTPMPKRDVRSEADKILGL